MSRKTTILWSWGTSGKVELFKGRDGSTNNRHEAAQYLKGWRRLPAYQVRLIDRSQHDRIYFIKTAAWRAFLTIKTLRTAK